jgi:hypothetical protein
MDNNERTNHFLPNKFAHRILLSGIHHTAFNLEYKDFILLLNIFLPKFKCNVLILIWGLISNIVSLFTIT